MNPRNFKIGIIGGGQLGKMLVQEAKRMDFTVVVLDPELKSPGGQLADEHIVGGLNDSVKIRELVEKCDVTTFEIENINTEILLKLEDEGNTILPSPRVLDVIKDKSKQKEMLVNNNLPTAKWERIKDVKETAKSLGLPFVQKACCGGYDGRGVYIIKNESDFEKALDTESLGEECVNIEKELAVMVARNTERETKSFPVVEMVFNEAENICDMIVAPGKIDKELERRVKELAVKTVEALSGVGVFGVEMFLTKDNEILINEIAPRVHNSGHYTIESCITSQFEQHLRAICGMPLGSAELIIPSVVVNILGEEGHYGNPYYRGLKNVLAIPGVNVHIYGKEHIKPFRKMGHVTVVDKDIEKAIEKAFMVKENLSSISTGVSSDE